MQEKELSIILSAIGWVLVGIGGLVAIIGGLIGYIFSAHKSDNDCEHERIETAMCDYRKEIREDINKIHSRIDRHLEDE